MLQNYYKKRGSSIVIDLIYYKLNPKYGKNLKTMITFW